MIRALIAAALAAATVAAAPAVAGEVDEFVDRCIKRNLSADDRIDVCTKLLKYDPAQPKVRALIHLARGNAYIAKFNRDRAIEDFTQAIRFDPNFSTAYFNRATGYREGHEFTRAIADYDQAIRLKPNYPNALGGRCYAKALAQRAREGLPDCERALQLQPGDQKLLHFRAMVFLAIRDLPNALREFDGILKRSPNFIPALVARAGAREVAGDAAGADADLRTANELGKRSPDAFNQLLHASLDVLQLGRKQ